MRDLLHDFKAPDFFDGHDAYSCPTCQGLVQQTCEVQPLGQVLLVQMKRFEYAHGVGEKISTHVGFQRELHIEDVQYNFIGMIEHQSTRTDRGHYVAYVEDSTIMCCNDKTITRISWADVKRKEAYLLAYIRTT